MKNIRCEWKGTTPLIMHSCRGVNPLDPLVIELKKLTAIRKKTDDDLRQISDIEWELGLYWDDNLGLYIPADNIIKSVQEGAQVRKRGKDIAKGFDITEMMVPLDIGESLTKDQLREQYRFRDVRAMSVMRAKVNRTRPRFTNWKLCFSVQYDEKILDISTIADAMEYAGSYIGICDSRTRKYGRFVCNIEELD